MLCQDSNRSQRGQHTPATIKKLRVNPESAMMCELPAPAITEGALAQDSRPYRHRSAHAHLCFNDTGAPAIPWDIAATPAAFKAPTAIL